MLLGLWLVGCGCPDGPPQVEGADDDTRAVISAALEDFSAWTGGAATCIDSVVATDGELSIDGVRVAGRYQPSKDTISVQADTLDLREVLFHEQCHALDEASLRISRNHADLFDGSLAEIDPDLYPPGRMAQREHFALSCEGAARQQRLLQAIRDTCGPVWSPTDVDSFIADVVFPDRPAPVAEVVRSESILLDEPFDSGGIALNPVSSQGFSLQGDTLQLLSVGMGGGGWMLKLDTVQLPEETWLETATVGVEHDRGWRWLPGEGEGLAVLETDLSVAYRWQAGEETLEPIPLPVLSLDADLTGGMLWDGDAWVWSQDRMWRVPLSGGTWAEPDTGDQEPWLVFPGPSGPAFLSTSLRLMVWSAGDWVLHGTVASGQWPLRLSEDGRLLSVLTLPSPLSEWTALMVEDERGEVVLTDCEGPLGIDPRTGSVGWLAFPMTFRWIPTP